MRYSTNLLRRPSRLLDRARHAMHFHEPPPRRTAFAAGGGMIALILIGLGIYIVLPEIRRYIHIERM